MSYDDNDLYSDRGLDEENNVTKSNRDMSNISDNIIFKNEEGDLMIKETEVSEEPRVSYCGIYSDSQFSAIINLTSSTIGSGCLNFPSILTSLGLPLTTIIYLFVSLSVYYTIDLLRHFVVDTKFFSFALMTETILGPKWLKVYAFCSFTIYTSMEVGYLSSIFMYTKGIHGLNSPFSIILYFVISTIIEIIICLNITRIPNLRCLSITTMFCYIIMLISLIIVSIIANATGEVKGKFANDKLFFPDINPDTLMNKLFLMSSYVMVYTFGYSYHSTFPTLIGTLKGVTHPITKKVHYISFGIICLAYLLISIFGYLLSKNVPNEIFQDNDDLVKGVWSSLRTPFKYILIFFLLFLIPIRFIVLRDNYITLIGKKKMTFFKELIIVGIFMIICNILVFTVSEFEEKLKELQIKNMIQAFGGMFGVIITFCLPVINYVAVNGKYKIKSLIGYVILVMFVLIGILSTCHSFYQIFF